MPKSLPAKGETATPKFLERVQTVLINPAWASAVRWIEAAAAFGCWLWARADFGIILIELFV